MLGGMSTVMLMQVRSVLSTLALLLLLALTARKHLRIRASALPGMALLAIPGLALVNASYYQAIQMLPVAVASFIQFTAPVLLFLYGVATKADRPSAMKTIALVLSLAGTYFMLQLKSDAAQSWPAFGLVCAFVSMLSYAFYVLVSHRLTKEHSPWTMVVYSYGIASLFWLVMQNPIETARTLSSRALWGDAALFSLCSTLIPFLVFLTGLRRVSPTGASIASTSETVMASLFAFIFLGETLAPAQILGAGLILLAVTLLILHPPAEVDRA
jgi:drug/metabolite transporter (DMT)-like permease